MISESGRTVTCRSLRSCRQLNLGGPVSCMAGTGKQCGLIFEELAPQGSRPTSILELRFGDIEVLLVKYPTDVNIDSTPKLLIRLTLEYTKRYLGPKATFLIPEIIHDPSLLLSPHVFLLAVLFRHRAFKAEALNDSPNILHTLKVPQDCFELPLSFKDDIKDKFVFRQAIKTSGGYQMSDTAITYSTMKEWIKRIGMLCGFETNTICYVLRYWAGNNLDQSMVVNVSSSLLNFVMENLVMEHAPNSRTFQRNYLCREVCEDLWAVHRNTAPQQALIQQAASHGHSTDPRRPVALSKDDLADLKLDPAYTKLTRKMFEAPRRSAQRQSLSKQRHNLLNQLRNAKLKHIRQEYTDKQAVEDVEQQIRGNQSSGTSRRSSRPMNDVHQRMCDALNQPVATDMKAYFD
ncbi:hypothetical protein G7054_g12426 [Neopestalotiopsis clavispora]|nr:hypothetical protein G7054_g12426 [Neopestalotiopsis clavispora]